jgi:acetate CoA/acetoacetate CoA-transferase beta subunit
MGVVDRNRIARRAAEEINSGMLVNLGIGIPSLVPNHLPEKINVMFHAENGIIGIGPSPIKGMEKENLCNAGGYPVTLVKGGAYCDSSIAFGMIRKGKVDITILGALQVSQNGDLANWIVPNIKVPGMGGAMELAQKAKRVIVLMNHCEKTGKSKIVKNCSLPLTTKASIDLVVTELAVFKVLNGELWLTELFAPFDEKAVQNITDADYKTAETLRKIPY